MHRQSGLSGVTTGSQGLIKALLHQVIGKVDDINHGQYPALSD
jgi:hypothetical protein